MRPWEWDICPADLWTEALEIRGAYQRGVEDAEAEALAEKKQQTWLQQEKVGQVG